MGLLNRVCYNLYRIHKVDTFLIPLPLLQEQEKIDDWIYDSLTQVNENYYPYSLDVRVMLSVCIILLSMNENLSLFS